MTDSVIKNKFFIILTAIVLVAGFLRFYNLTEVPVSLYWDEVSIGYNAYSIAETGADEFGNKLPLLFRAFEDYKTPGSIYLTTVPVFIFGLNEFSVRFPSALLGTLTVLLTFFLVIELVKRKKLFGFDTRYIALLTSFLVAISPWHLQFSRAGFEANSGLFFVVLGAFLFLKFANTSKFKYLFASMVIFAISIYFYRSIWIFTPLILTSFFIIYHKTLFTKENVKKTLLSILLFVAVLVPFVPAMFSSEGMTRAGQAGIVNSTQEKVYELALKQEGAGFLGKVIYNRRLVYLYEGGKGYLRHFSPKFLFLEGDGNSRHGVGSVGVLYAWAVIFIIPGLFALFKLDRRVTFISILWLLFAPLAAAASTPTPHALRSLNMIPIIQFVVAMGMVWLFSFVGNKYRAVASAFVVGTCLFFFINYLGIYHGQYAQESSSGWADGYKQLVKYTKSVHSKYDKILITGHWWQPHAFFLFYNKYDPALYQELGNKTGFDKYIFGGTSWDMGGSEFGDQDLKRTAGTDEYIVALSPNEFEIQKEKLSIIKEIRNVNNEIMFIIAVPK